MAPVSLSCPHCHASCSAEDVAAARKCQICGARLAVPNDLADTASGRPGGQPGSVSTDSQTAAVGRSDHLNFLTPARGPDELGWLGPYRVLSLLGAGGMGIVLKAEDPNLRRRVALKVLRPKYAVDAAARKRFIREARAAAAVEHDHIVPIFQISEARGTAYLAMPLLKGEALSATIKRSGVLPVAECVRIGREIAEGLAAAHDAGLIHRDIKPGNVWLEGSRRRVRILDFGLARVMADSGAGDQSITREGAIVGTPAYMSPEQARGNKLDGRSDLFSLGVVIYQMVTGHLPFRGANSTAVLLAIVMEEPRPPIALNPAIPQALNDLILRLLNKNPAGRPATADNLARLLSDIESGFSAIAHPLVVEQTSDSEIAASVFADLGASSTFVAPVRPEKRPKKAHAKTNVSRAVYYWSGLAGLILLIGVAVIFWQLFGSPSRGTLVIDSDDPNAEVVVRRDGDIVQQRTRNREIRLRAGDYVVELADRRPGLRLSPTDPITLSRGGRETVWIRTVGNPPIGGPPKKLEKPPITTDPIKPTPLVINGPTPPGGTLPPYQPESEPLPPWNLPKGAPAPALHPFGSAEARQFQESWAKHVGKPVTVENKIGMSFALIPPGEFDFRFTDSDVGHAPSDAPTIRARLSRPYYLGTTEVTIGQFEAFVKATGYKTEAEATGEGGWVPDKWDPKATWRKPREFDLVDPRHPVVQISWNDANAFCEWLGKQDGVTYRLPTEAEWRFAARAGSKLKFGPADSVEDFRYHEWTANDTVEAGKPPYRPVGVKRANWFGLHDMLGNVDEWVLDVNPPEAARYFHPVDPVGPLHHAARLGGNFNLPAADISPDLRRWSETRPHRRHNTGFRVLREVGATKLDANHAARVRPGQSLSTRSLVPKPERIAGLRSWSVELAGPVGNVLAVAWSPAGDRIATSHDTDWAIRLWDRTGNLVSVLPGHDGLIGTMAFSRDGKRLASSGETLRIWDVGSGTCFAVFPAPPPTAYPLTFSNDGNALLCAGPSGAGELDLATGRYTGPSGTGFPFNSWSPDRTHLLVATNAAGAPPVIWKVNPREKVADLKVLVNGKEQEPATCWAVAWSPDGKWLAAGRNTNPLVVHVWDAKTFELKSTIPAVGGLSLAWHPDSRRLAIPGSGLVDALDGTLKCDFTGDKNPFAWSPDGSEGISGNLFRAAATGQGLQSLSNRGQAGAGPFSLSPDGKLLIDTSARPVRLRDAETGAIVHDLIDLVPGSQTTWSPTSDRLAVWGLGGVAVRLVDPQTGALKLELKDAVNVSRVAWAPDGRHLATAVDKDIVVWDAIGGTRVQQMARHSGAIHGLVWSPDGTRLASAALDNTVRIWEPLTGIAIANHSELPEPAATFAMTQPLAWSPDGLTLWVARTGAHPLDVRSGRFGPIEQLYVSNSLIGLTTARDGKLLAKDSTEWVTLRAGDPPGKLVLGPGLGIAPHVPVWLSDARRFLCGSARANVAFDTFTHRRLGTLFPVVGSEHWLVVGPTGHYRGTVGVEPNLVYVAMHDDGSQRTYSPAAFAEKFGWKNDPERATLLKLDPAESQITAPPAEGYWPRLAALNRKGGRFWKADDTEVSGVADLQAGAVLKKMVFQAPPGTAPLSDADVDALRNLPAIDGTLRLEGAGVSDTGLARLLGFAVFEKITALEVVDTPAGDATIVAAAGLRGLTRLVLTGTQITDTGLASLKAAKKLESLDLRRNKLTKTRVEALSATIPACRIEWDSGVIEPTKK